jgi:hypothetical protein
MRFPFTMFTLQSNVKPLLLRGEEVEEEVEVTMNSKEENS